MEFYKLEVASKQYLTDEACTITFTVPRELKTIFQYKPGQHLTLKIEEQRREYSICNSPLDQQLSIGVKKAKNGKISSYLVNNLKAGDIVEVSQPNGFFGIPGSGGVKRTILAFAAGSGITPILSIIRHTLQTEPLTEVFLFYGNKTTETVMFYEELKKLKMRYADNFQLYLSYSQAQSEESLFKGRFNATNIKMIVERLRSNNNLEHLLICGPDQLREKIVEVASNQGIKGENIHFERFASYNNELVEQPELIDVDLAENVLVTITKNGTTSQIAWNKQISLLHALLKAGIDAPYSCSRGQCGTCVCKLEEGKVHLKRNFVLAEPHLQSGLILPCVSIPVSETIKITYDTF